MANFLMNWAKYTLCGLVALIMAAIWLGIIVGVPVLLVVFGHSTLALWLAGAWSVFISLSVAMWLTVS